MRLRTRTLLVIGVTLLALLAAIYVVANTVLQQGFAGLEDREARLSVNRVLRTLDNETDSIANSVLDYSNWEDTYAFAQGRNDAYRTLLDALALSNLNVDAFVVSDAAGTVLLSQGVDRSTGAEAPVSPELLRKFPALTARVMENNGGSERGLLSLPEGLLLFAARPIVRDDGSGPPAGALLFGRYLDQSEVSRISDLLQSPLQLYVLGKDDLPANIAALRTTLLPAGEQRVKPINNDVVAGYTALRDIDEQPVAILRVDSPRTISAQGRISNAYLIAAIFLVGLVFGLVTLVLIEWMVLRRVGRLSADVNRIAQDGDVTQRVDERGADELSMLGADINQMLANFQTAQRELAHSEERFRSVVESVDDLIFTLDREGRFTSFAGRPLALYGLTADRMVNQTLRAVMGEMSAVFDLAFAQALDGQNAVFEWSLVNVEDGITYFQISLSSLRDADGATIGLVGVARDISTLKHLERVKAEFVANISHDLRTPLASILGYAELLLRGRPGPLTALQAEFVQTIYDSSKRLKFMVDDMLDMSRIEVGRFRMQFELIDLAELVRAAGETAQAEATAAAVALAVTVPDALPRVLADPRRIAQVLDHLLGNAVKFTQADGRVEINAAIDDGAVCLVVADSGIGIPPDELPQLFTRFHCASNATDVTSHGSGLGLYISRAIVEAHAGRIAVESELGKGSTFRVWIPMPVDAPNGNSTAATPN